MNNVPSVKTHPVLVSIITMTFVLAVLLAGIVSGWFLRAMLESRAELAVVVDDGNFMQALEIQTQKWVEEYNLFDEEFHDGQDTPDCLALPMPSRYHDNDFRMRSDRQHEE